MTKTFSLKGKNTLRQQSVSSCYLDLKHIFHFPTQRRTPQKKKKRENKKKSTTITKSQCHLTPYPNLRTGSLPHFQCTEGINSNITSSMLAQFQKQQYIRRSLDFGQAGGTESTINDHASEAEGFDFYSLSW